MSAVPSDLFYILVAIIGTGISLAGLILPDLRSMKRDIGELRNSIGELRERMARIEGLFEGFARRENNRDNVP